MPWPNSAGTQLPLTQALALGALQGPTEVLPVSSSGHLALAPWLLGWDFERLEPGLRKTFEVALHGGSGAALALASLGEAAELRRGARLLVLALAPSVALGYAYEGAIEARLGTPASVARGLIAGGVAMALADRLSGTRRGSEADARDALWLGLAQACALHPGVSRGGATLTAARLRRFAPADAELLSRQMALPVIVGASALKAWRLRSRRPPAELRSAFLAGTVAAFASTLASGRLLRARGEVSLMPVATYRIALGAAVLLRVRSSARSTTMAR